MTKNNSDVTSSCRICGHDAEPLLDLGLQPISSHYLADPALPAPERRLVFGRCQNCGTAQLLPPFPNECLTPPYPWISYREPEGHLDRLVEIIAALPGVGAGSRIAGVSFKDRSTLERFARKGFATWCLDVKSDLGASHPYANIESVPSLLTEGVAASIVARRGAADVVFARHVLEHAADPKRLLAALTGLLRDGGYLVLEVPDNEKNIARQDYTMIWEEHAFYFTSATFAGIYAGTCLSPVSTAVFPYRFEDVLVTIARKRSGFVSSVERMEVATDDGALRAYAAAFPNWTRRYREAIVAARAGGVAALYGAGHLTAAFVNFHGFSDLFRFVVDDTPEKQGLRLPNSGLEIVPRDRLVREGVRLCLFGLSPDIEDKVIANNADYVRGGGRFLSMFVDSSRSLRTVCED